MMRSIPILADASLPDLASAFPAPFQLHYYQKQSEIGSVLKGMQVLLCRSTLSIDEGFFTQHTLQYVATASSGIDHLNADYLLHHQIGIIDAKSCNAQAVADYVVSSIAYLQQKNLLQGKFAGVMGYGEVGKRVVKRLKALGFDVLIYDPFLGFFDDLKQCDLLCIHANRHNTQPYPSQNSLNDSFLSDLKPGTVIINAARGGIVDEQALLRHQDTVIYCTDVYSNEPHVNPALIDYATLCTPHIAGHSIEAKQRAIQILSTKLHHAYSLPSPVFTPFTVQKFKHDLDWQDTVLSLYNPQNETILFKEAKDKHLAFLELRKAHHFRHDFYLYPTKDPLRLILGQ